MTAAVKERAAGTLDFPYGNDRADTPAPGTTIEVAPGVHWLRMPLPFALDHINLWLLEEAGGWTIVDTGMNLPETQDHWRNLFSGVMQQRPVNRLVVTHFHPDHMGLAGWLTEECGTELWTTRTEWLMARMLCLDVEGAAHATNLEFLKSHGLAERWLAEMRGWGNSYSKRVRMPPAHFNRLCDGDELEMGGRVWRIIVGTGHAPEHACLYCPELEVLISGDQILPKISPNIAVWGSEPDADPLADYLGSLDRFRRLPVATLVLPSHNYPFTGLHTRLDQLAHHHEERLDRLLGAFGDLGGTDAALTAADLIPVLFRRELDVHQMSFAMGESVAHLAYLSGTGRLVRETGADGLERYRLQPS